MKRRTSYLHNLSLIHFLTFAFAVAVHFHILSTTTVAATTTNVNPDAAKSTTKLQTAQKSTTLSTFASSSSSSTSSFTSSSASSSSSSSLSSSSSSSSSPSPYPSASSSSSSPLSSLLLLSAASVSASALLSSPTITDTISTGTGTGTGTGMGTSTSSTIDAIYENKTSMRMNSSSSSILGISSAASGRPLATRAVANGVEDGGVGGDHGHGASSTRHAFKSTSKMPPLDSGLARSHWSADTGLVSNSNAGAGLFATAVRSVTTATTSTASVGRIFRSKHHHERHWGPFFEEPLNSTSTGDNLVSTAHLFTEAVLNCRVGMLKDKTVMWVRRTAEKVSLLTVGNVTYSGDPRIRVKFQYPNNWRLLINPTQKEDAGVYMCQVSTHPPRVFTTNLTVLESPLRLIDDQEREVADRYYKSGSTIDLQCQISRSFLLKEHTSIVKSVQPVDAVAPIKATSHKDTKLATVLNLGVGSNVISAHSDSSATNKTGQGFEKQFIKYIFWSKDDGRLPEMAVMRSSTTVKWLISRISIPDAKLADSGNYSCSIGKLFTAIVQVQVLTGELPAAVQHNSAASARFDMVLQFNRLCLNYLTALVLISWNISSIMRIGLKLFLV